MFCVPDPCYFHLIPWLFVNFLSLVPSLLYRNSLPQRRSGRLAAFLPRSFWSGALQDATNPSNPVGLGPELFRVLLRDPKLARSGLSSGQAGLQVEAKKFFHPYRQVMCMVLVSNYEKIIYYRVVRRLFPFIPTLFKNPCLLLVCRLFVFESFTARLDQYNDVISIIYSMCRLLMTP